MKPSVIKYSDGNYEVYDGIYCHTTDKQGAIKLISRLMLKGTKFKYYYENIEVSPKGFFTKND